MEVGLGEEEVVISDGIVKIEVVTTKVVGIEFVGEGFLKGSECRWKYFSFIVV